MVHDLIFEERPGSRRFSKQSQTKQNNLVSDSRHGLLLAIDDFDNFKEVKNFNPTEISSEVITTVRSLDEREELEPFIRAILADMGETPHGPSEIADILTHKVTVKGRRGIAAFILKGKSFSTVRPKDVSHQIYRLQKIEGLEFAILGAPGTILDPAKEEFCSTCQQIESHYAIFDAVDFARLFVAHGFLCPRWQPDFARQMQVWLFATKKNIKSAAEGIP